MNVHLEPMTGLSAGTAEDLQPGTDKLTFRGQRILSTAPSHAATASVQDAKARWCNSR
jgi:hypothetical protein